MFQSFDLNADKAATPGRVAALRAAMTEVGVTGFLVPRADAHQGEQVAPHDERLAWLTGFTGSAGTAVVLADTAGFFVDGRYTLQAANQVSEDLFAIQPIHETPVDKWLREVLTQGDRIGYDPWLHGKEEIDRLRGVAKDTGGALVSLSENLVDRIWEDQPPPPAGAVRIHPLEFAGEEAAAKRRSIGTEIAAQGAAAAVISLPDSIAWLLNIRGSDLSHSPVAHGFALARADGQVALVMNPDKVDGAVREHLGNEVAIHAPDELASLIAELPGPVLLDSASCPLWFAERFAASGQEVIWKRDPCIAPKARKNQAELAGMRAAHRTDGVAMVRFLHWLDTALAAGETLTEIDVVERLEAFRAEDPGLHDISFDTIAGSGPNGAMAHYRVNRQSNRTIVPGELLLVDSGGQYDRGTTDITRTMATGAVTADQRRQFTLVLKGMIAISRIRWPAGLSGRDLDPLARAALWRAGLDYDHGTGHGVGACLNVHEGPQNLSRRSVVPFVPGMIVSNEPGFYLTGSHGIRIENLVAVTGPSIPEGGNREMLGFETLTWAPIDRRLIDPALLDGEETAWLNDYHAEVLARISPALEGEVAAWLAHACAAIGDPGAGNVQPGAASGDSAAPFRLAPAAGTVVIRAGGAVIAESRTALIMDEGTYAPVYYLPRRDAGIEFLSPSGTVTRCPHKGAARHYHLRVKSGTIEDAAWSYEEPLDQAQEIRGYIAYYADKVTVEVL